MLGSRTIFLLLCFCFTFNYCIISAQQKITHQQPKFNKAITADLLSIYHERLKADEQLREMLAECGSNSVYFKMYRDSVIELDTIDDIKLRSIINTYGWPGPDEIGGNGVTALIYLFQKTGYDTQSHYFPLIVKAYKSGTINPYDYAIIADKLSLQNTGRQLYGTQSGRKIDNRDSVNVRRCAIGIDTLAMP